jgi:hypothetical protein
MRISEDSLVSWSKGPAATEQQQCEHAETAIGAAVLASPLADMNITIFAQGSYRNKTNVRQNSDVDICIRLNSTIFPAYPEGTSASTFGNTPATITFAQYKQLVESALQEHFGKPNVKRGKKAFNVRENTYRIDADVVPTFEHRRYGFRTDGSPYWLSGIAFDTDDGQHIINWPQQNYDNGLAKHEATGRRFRKMVRIVKRLRDLMQTERIPAASNVASCLIEALVWNAPPEAFGHSTLTDDFRDVLAHTFNNTMNDQTCSEWGEVNELKYLFRPAQPWTRAKANAFLDSAWNRAGFD